MIGAVSPILGRFTDSEALRQTARALTPQTAETDAIRFLVGTQSLKYDNQRDLKSTPELFIELVCPCPVVCYGPQLGVCCNTVAHGGLQDCEGKSIQELCRCVQVKDFPAVCFISTPEHPQDSLLVTLPEIVYQEQARHIHIIDFDDENNIINKNVLLHQAGEIWHISASPADKGVLATCYNKSKCPAYYSVYVSAGGVM
ncbi:hypothetical protein U0070_018999 [Myodes glareolus]|uniref:Uncharacterized protein n=1 Tax=Myodes glareolus TaxID=447135 RepID=A0AAW0GY09_MYOGA